MAWRKLTSFPTFFLVCVDPEQEIQQFVIIAVVIQWLRM